MSEQRSAAEPGEGSVETPARSVRRTRFVLAAGVAVICVLLGLASGALLRQRGVTWSLSRGAAPTGGVAADPGSGEVSAGHPQPTPRPDVEVIEDLAELPPGPVDTLELAYFHRTHRCSGCIKAEELTRRTLDAYYADRLSSGDMVLRVEDVEQPADPTLVRKYDAFGSSLYLGVVKNGVTYVYAVNDIWFELADEEGFKAMLRGKIDAALGSS